MNTKTLVLTARDQLTIAEFMSHLYHYASQIEARNTSNSRGQDRSIRAAQTKMYYPSKTIGKEVDDKGMLKREFWFKLSEEERDALCQARMKLCKPAQG